MIALLISENVCALGVEVDVILLDNGLAGY